MNSYQNLTLVIRYFVIVFLAILTLAHAVFVDEYLPVDQDLVFNSQFENNLEGWQVAKRLIETDQISVENGNLHLSASNKKITISQQIPVPSGYQFIQVSVNASIKNVVERDRGLKKARIYLVNKVDGKYIWELKHHIFSLVGSLQGQRYMEVFQIHPQAESLSLGIQLTKAGEMWVNDIKVYPAVKNKQAAMFKQILLVLWIFVIFWFVLPFLKQKQKQSLIIVAASLVALVMIVMPKQYKHEVVNRFEQQIASPLYDLSEQVKEKEIDLSLFKIGDYSITTSLLGHFLIFFTLTCIVILVNKGLSLKVCSLLIGGAAVSEILQYFSIARQPRITDFSADFFGILAAVLLFLLYLLIRKRICTEYKQT